MIELVKFSVESGVGLITVDNPPVNALSAGVPEGIAAAIEQAAHDTSVCAVVSDVGRAFAIPKSTSLTEPVFSTITFSGLISR